MPRGESQRQGRDVPMKHAPSLDSIEGQLSRALRQFAALPGGSEQFIGVPLDSGLLGRTAKNILEKKSEWLAAVLHGPP